MEIVMAGRSYLSEDQGLMGSGWSYQNLEARRRSHGARHQRGNVDQLESAGPQ